MRWLESERGKVEGPKLVDRDTQPWLVGINLGTSKVVAAWLDPAKRLSFGSTPLRDSGSPDAWMSAMAEVLVPLSVETPAIIALCGTSGTFVLTDEAGEVVGRVSLYNESIPETAKALQKRYGSRRNMPSGLFDPDSPVVRLAHDWANLSPDERRRVRWLIPQSIWMSYQLTQGELWREMAGRHG